MSVKPKNSKSKVVSKRSTSVKEISDFPIVGIGASAGGLEAIEQFLSSVPENCGMAYVVIQHLDPTQKGMLPELLQRITKLKVLQVKDRMSVTRNTIYVIPPNKSMSMLNRVLYLFEPVESRGMRLPIDFFFRSLAADCKELAVGVVLSGMGSDGSIGLRAIKENNGIVMVQDPLDAKFDSMPRNSIDSVLIDIMAPAKDLHVKLVEYLEHVPFLRSKLEVEKKDGSSLDKIIILLRTHTGNDFTLYKKNTLYRRVERRMGIHKIDKIISYVNFLQSNPKEIEILFKELLIGVTNFFRDPEVWKKMKEKVFPDIFSTLQPGSVLRAWVPGCSTGEEAYSLAIVFKEAIENSKVNNGITLQIFATDLDTEAIDIARKAVFPLNIITDVSPDRLSHFFMLSDEGYKVKTEIREMVVFANHNVILHPPFTKLDILSCRNLLIYMDNELQKKLLGLFFYSLNNNGIMLLGSSESLGGQSNLFNTIDNKLKIFKRLESSQLPELMNFPSSFSRSKTLVTEKPLPRASGLNIQTVADQLLLQYYSPSAVFVNELGDVIYVYGHTGKYLEPAAGKANLNIFAMIRDDLRQELHLGFRQAVVKKQHVSLHNLKLRYNGMVNIVNIEIIWIDKPDLLYGYLMIVFADIKEITQVDLPAGTKNKAISSVRQLELENDLEKMREEMQNTLEELQTGQEELRSTNEELQSTNEELQSTNEELTTSKEEMQSLNEELQTVNVELQTKVDDYSRINNDMKNLLNSTEIATLFLDKELNIRRYTIQATKIFKLIKSDIGRPFTDQVTELNYNDLADDVVEVLRTLVYVEKEVPAKDGRWFLVRIMPYRTFDDRIDGIVITFINITDHKRIESKLQEAERISRALLNSSANAKLILSNSFDILDFNPKAEKLFGLSRENCINKNFIQMFVPEKEHKGTEKKLKMLVDKKVSNKINDKFRMKLKTTDVNKPQVDCIVTLSYYGLSFANGMILSIKKQKYHE
jgi:two-component system CheB/CheR fusion protein